MSADVDRVAQDRVAQDRVAQEPLPSHVSVSLPVSCVPALPGDTCIGNHRAVAIDFYRGLAMLIIVIDHIGGSILSRFTPHVFAFPDAAEAFVFLSGFAMASAWSHWTTRALAPLTVAAARARVRGRLWRIYLGFLLCAGAMLLLAWAFRLAGISAPNLPVADLNAALAKPLSWMAELLLLEHQPYLASVLPMYLAFVLAASFVLHWGLRRPLQLFCLSVGLWSIAPALWGASPVSAMPSANGGQASWGALMTWFAAWRAQWMFNPLAWQLIFVSGIVARSDGVRRFRAAPRRRAWLTGLCIIVVLVAAVWRIWITPGYLDPMLKRQLAGERVVNFIAIAWLCAVLASRGWIDRLAARLPWIVSIGRQSLLFFVAGAVLSLTLDTLLFHATSGYLDYPAGVLTDIIAILAMFAMVRVPRFWQTSRRTGQNDAAQRPV